MTARVARRDRSRDRGDVEVERVRIDVHEHRLRAAQLDRVGRRGERVGGDDHLVAGADLEREQGEMERGGARRHGRCVRRPDGIRDRALELVDLRPHRELPGAHDLGDRSELGSPDVRLGEPDRVGHPDEFSRYHAIVRSSPSSRSTFASKPRSSRAFSMFGMRSSTSV